MARSPLFEELDFQKTALGDLILRRRIVSALDNREVFEIILGDAFLMSSLFTIVEQELAHLGLAAVRTANENTRLDVVVGGLGLGCTATAALESSRVGSLKIIDFLEPVIKWHQSELLPLGSSLNADSRCQYIHGDFFEMALSGFNPSSPNDKYHAVLLDIDHSPEKLLHQRHSNLYTETGLEKLSHQLYPGGVFALWSDDAPEEKFIQRLKRVFPEVHSEIVYFDNPLQDRRHSSTVYVATKAMDL